MSSELANGINMGNEENGEFQISLLSGWWAVFTEIKEIGKKTFWEESLEFSLRCKFGVKSESHSVVSNSLGPHGLYSPWNSPGQDTGVGSLSLLQQIFPTYE